MEGHASISADILGRYAADVAMEVPGVRAVLGRQLPPQRGVKVVEADGRVTIELRLGVEWGASIPDVARGVQRRVHDYLATMADLDAVAVDVVVDEIGVPA